MSAAMSINRLHELHATFLANADSSRRQIMSGRTIFGREYHMHLARNMIAAARNAREAITTWGK